MPPRELRVACPQPTCGGANDARFRFCQWCGVKRLRVQRRDLTGSVDDGAIARRRAEVFAGVEDKAHEVSKHKEMDMFGVFLETRPTESLRRTSVFDASPADVVDFLVQRDLAGTGHTIVHERTCIVGEADQGTKCDCPKRLSNSAVHAMASKLKTRFAELGGGGEWSNVSFSGNPADSALVRKYTAAIQEEQGRACCVPVTARAKALLPEQLKALVCSIRNEAYTHITSDRIKYLTALQDVAWITIAFRSLNRGAELSDLRVENTAIGPNDSCLLFQFTFTKVLRGGGANEFGVPALPNDVTCPIRAFKQYVQETSRLLAWDWDKDTRTPVFAIIGAQGIRSSVAVAPAAMNQRLQRHIAKCKAIGNHKVTLHGLRASGALDMALRGVDLKDIMLQGFWKEPKTALHYIGLLEAVVGPEFTQALQQQNTVGTAIPGTRPSWKEVLRV